MTDSKACWPFWHRWTGFSAPQVATTTRGPEVMQRRVCKRCNAVDYRRVMVSNG